MSIRSKKLAGAAALAAAMAIGSASAEAALFLDYNVIPGGTASGTGKAVTGTAGQTAVVEVSVKVVGTNSSNDDGIQSIRTNFAATSSGGTLTLGGITSAAFGGSGSVLTTPATAVFRAPETVTPGYKLNSALNRYTTPTPPTDFTPFTKTVLGTFTVTLGGSGAVTLANTFNVDASYENGGPVYVTDGVAVLPEADATLQSQGAPISFTVGAVGPSFLLGDFNFDGVFDVGDIDGFVAAISEGDPFSQFIVDNQAAFGALYPGQTLDAGKLNTVIGDFNGDTVLDVGDIDGFVAGLSGRSALSVVPEPTSLGLVATLGFLGVRRRRTMVA